MGTPTTKVWKASKDGVAGMVVSEDTSMLIANDNVVAVNANGVTLSGPISITADSKNIRTGGLFVGIDSILEMVPSTIITPTPKHIPVPPVHGLLSLKEDVEFFRSLLV